MVNSHPIIIYNILKEENLQNEYPNYMKAYSSKEKILEDIKDEFLKDDNNKEYNSKKFFSILFTAYEEINYEIQLDLVTGKYKNKSLKNYIFNMIEENDKLIRYISYKIKVLLKL